MVDAFYEAAGDGVFTSTPHTAGPWFPDAQHLGPPSALLVRALEALPGDRESLIARVTVDILGPVPVTEVAVSARVERPGRSVEQLRGELSADGRLVATATAWRIASSDTGDRVTGSAGALPAVSHAAPATRPPEWRPGYLDAMDWYLVHGAFGEPGPACAWVRQRVDLVSGERPSPLQRLMTVADSGNGLSSPLGIEDWLFINTELTVHVQREPVDEWVGIDANTVIGPRGVGTATSVLHDRLGQVATGAQALLVRRRKPG
ncbi:Thioesterase-like superfamily protein [Haloechinothrix alba]|uniref:Thioesterase-like superfamily protein n=1 Tax=Haloechinothrix alba TaxID=664784 RepID=A0A238X8M0_9PSEU|nr:thioesterase family protein [Haloechinothrix alba]SNR55297.1 Thioesterase-like superfamily protein [Haloechinothrix alba]